MLALVDNIESQIQLLNQIQEIESNSYNQILVKFVNGYALSIINNGYGNDSFPYEIAPIDPHGDLNGSLLDIEDDDVIGYLNHHDVVRYMHQMAALTKMV